ncbi:hypothetical protein NG796_16965 [Laspinema sp. A4]|uniref:hypothetical protein n=1 Tax=Laspinema sp. D2d TaxID=2953686 RepID=UPI0021BB497F|nr:hypothetical protein [Laspinema sp. D2d]MCT7984965.1 hypothetical protein [Laspinema sp. D2d]
MKKLGMTEAEFVKIFPATEKETFWDKIGVGLEWITYAIFLWVILGNPLYGVYQYLTTETLEQHCEQIRTEIRTINNYTKVKLKDVWKSEWENCSEIARHKARILRNN